VRHCRLPSTTISHKSSIPFLKVVLCPALQSVHACRDLKAGEELTINYLGEYFLLRAKRRAELRHNFAFDCACEACSAPHDVVAESDKRREQLAQLQSGIYRHIADSNTAAALAGQSALLLL